MTYMVRLNPFELAVRKIWSVFTWELVRSKSGINSYYENTLTGDRYVLRPSRGVMSPIDQHWLALARGKAWYYDRHGKCMIDKTRVLDYYANRGAPPPPCGMRKDDQTIRNVYSD